MIQRLAPVAVLGLAAVLLAPSPAHAQQRPWAIVLEGGVADMHGRTEADGGAGALRVSRRLAGYDWLRGEIAFTGGSADTDFATAEVGVELRWCGACRFAVFVGGGGGYMVEDGTGIGDDFDGGMVRGNLGVEYRLGERFAARLMAQAGTHDGVRGPHLAMLGLVWRFGGTGAGPAAP